MCKENEHKFIVIESSRDRIKIGIAPNKETMWGHYIHCVCEKCGFNLKLDIGTKTDW